MNSPTNILRSRSAYAYSRFSTAAQADGDSLRRQQNKVEAWAKQNPGYALTYLHDAGLSAFKGLNRTLGQFGTFLQELREGKLGDSPVLLIENFDRLSREEIEEAQALFLELINRGAEVVTTHNGRSYKKPLSLTDIIVALLEMDLANKESSKKSERVREAYANRRKSGAIMHTSANCPRWHRLVDRREFVPIPARVAVLEEIFTMAASGLGQYKIARSLNERGLKPWGGGAYWHPGNLRKLISSRIVRGDYNPDGEPVRIGYFPAVITEDLWTKANARETRVGTSRGLSHDEAHLFRGLMFSGLDGTAMIHRRGATATPETRAIHNRIAYVRNVLKDAKGERRDEMTLQLDKALADRKAMNVVRRKAGRSGYEYRYQLLASMGTISAASKVAHRVKYEDVEEAVLWFVRNASPELLTEARNNAAGFALAAAETARNTLRKAEKQVAKLTRLILSDDDPSPALVTQLKNAEAAVSSAKQDAARAETDAEKCSGRPRISEIDLTNPEGRRRVRAELARWCTRIVVNEDEVIIYFSRFQGIAVSLEKGPMGHDLWLHNDTAAELAECGISAEEDTHAEGEAPQLAAEGNVA